jgi:gliding motility-associated-like protein
LYSLVLYRLKTVFALAFVALQIFMTGVSAQSLLLENKGRMPDFVTYTKQFSNGMTYYRKNGFSVVLKDQTGYDSFWHHFHKYKSLKHDFTLKYHRFDMEFLDALPCDIAPEFVSPSKYHFYKGSDPAGWHTNLRGFHQITYKNLYKGIDWQVQGYGDNSKHNFIVYPGADPSSLRMQYTHTTDMSVKDGALIISTSTGTVTEQKPLAFQLINGDTTFITCRYALKKTKKGFVVSFETGVYNQQQILVIDPILVFSTYSGSKGDNFGFTSTYDSKSHLYAGGIVDGGTGADGGPFPVTPGAFQEVYSGGVGKAPANLPCDIGINKYDSAGTTLLYSTYLGGGKDEYPHSLVVDHQDNLLVMGTCYSSDFPVDPAGYDPVFNGFTDIFVVKLKEDGSDMLGGTFMGGSGKDGLNDSSVLRYNYADDFRGDVAVDKTGNIYVASTTKSINFPVKGFIQNSRASRQDGCVFSLDSNLRNLRFSTYMGGNGDDAMYSIRLYDTFVYVGGGTASNAMAFAVNGNKNTYNGGRADGFIAKMTLNGQLLNSTYFGTSDYDQIYFLDIDANGQVYAAGQTEGNISRTGNTYGKDRTSQFIVRFAPNIAVINLATTFGNRVLNPEISPSAFLVDKCDNIYFSGWGSPISYDGLHSLTTNNLQITSDALQKTTDKQDFYLLVLNKDARNLLFATYYGGNKTEDHVDGGTSRFDKKGVVYQSVCSSCPGQNQHFDDFPVSPNAPFKLNLSPRCSNATFKIDFQINFEVDAKFTANPTSGCQPLRVEFTNQSKKARKYFWDFGDGSPVDTSKNPVHIFMNPGKFKVRLTSVDSFSCNISEMDSTEIEVKESPIADFEYKTEECSREFKFTNKSSKYTGPTWDFGDSTSIVSDENPIHTFIKDGEFRTLLTVIHPVSGCIDTQSTVIRLYGNPIQSIRIPNVFTPNADNTNDCYTISGITPNCDEAEMWIYDRWGVLVFKGVLPDDCWNGTLKNTWGPLASGVYYYILHLKSKNPSNNANETINGVIHLIR